MRHIYAPISILITTNEMRQIFKKQVFVENTLFLGQPVHSTIHFLNNSRIIHIDSIFMNLSSSLK